MADIKFHCPECQQRIAVDETAAGIAIDCPYCKAGIIIPARGTDPVQLTRRSAANGGGAVVADPEELRKWLR